MKWKTRTLFLSLIGVLALVVRAEGATDEEIRRRLVLSCSFEDDASLARGAFNGAFRAAESNRVRFARIICDLARTNDASIACGMISELGDYGTPAQLPFLYSQVSNTQYGVDAVRSILKIEGITSNSMAMVDGYLSNTNMVMPMREDTCLELLRRRNQTNLGSELSNCVDQCAFRFFGSDKVYSEWYDELVQPLIPGYKYSRRRLNVLQAVQQLGLTKYNDVFVTNAINELVAYPESELPE